MQSPRLYANGVYAVYAARPCDHRDEEDPQPGAPPAVVPQQRLRPDEPDAPGGLQEQVGERDSLLELLVKLPRRETNHILLGNAFTSVCRWRLPAWRRGTRGPPPSWPSTDP